jgi:hypothetical protein
LAEGVEVTHEVRWSVSVDISALGGIMEKVKT